MRRRRRGGRIRLIAFGCALAAAHGASAGGDLWLNPAGGAFSVGANWSTGAPPAETDDAIFQLGAGDYLVSFAMDRVAARLVIGPDTPTFDLGGRRFELTSTIAALPSIVIAANAANAGALALSNGTLAGVDIAVGGAAGAAGLLSLSGGARVESSGWLIVGQAGAGALDAAAGAELATTHVAIAESADGVARLDGAGALWTVSATLPDIGALRVGAGDWEGTTFVFDTPLQRGELAVTGGAVLESQRAFIGDTRNGAGTLVVSGAASRWTNLGNEAYVGYLGDGVLRVLDGGSVETRDAVIGRLGVRDVLLGAAEVDGAGSTWDAFDLFVGHNDNSSCLFGANIYYSEGSLAVSNGGSVTATSLTIAGRWKSKGTVTVSGADAVLSVPIIALGTPETALTCFSEAELRVETGGLVVADGAVDIHLGRVMLDGGTLSTPAVTLRGDHLIDPNDPATLGGTGTIVGDAENFGGVTSPGDRVGVLTIQGDYAQRAAVGASAPTLRIDVAGLEPGVEFDRLEVSGTAALAGVLDIRRSSSLAPKLGATLEILSAGAVVGRFDAVVGDAISENRRFAVRYGPTSVTLVVSSNATPGDLDEDGDVDLEDLTTLLAAFGNCVGDPSFNPPADLDGDGCIGLGDLTVLLGNYGL